MEIHHGMIWPLETCVGIWATYGQHMGNTYPEIVFDMNLRGLRNPYQPSGSFGLFSLWKNHFPEKEMLVDLIWETLRQLHTIVVFPCHQVL